MKFDKLIKYSVRDYDDWLWLSKLLYLPIVKWYVGAHNSGVDMGTCSQPPTFAQTPPRKLQAIDNVVVIALIIIV